MSTAASRPMTRRVRNRVLLSYGLARRARWAAAALAVVAGIALLAPAPAPAGAQAVNVSNLSQSTSNVSAPFSFTSTRYASAFSIPGASADRYTLTSV